MKGHQLLIDAAISALDRLEQRQFLSAGKDGHDDAIRALRNALMASGVRRYELPWTAKRRRAAIQRIEVGSVSRPA